MLGATVHGSRSTNTVLGRRPGSVGCLSYSHATLAFFEAYFSNFIEGTEFAVDEAADIAFRGAVPNERPADAHDVLGTWRIVSDTREMGPDPHRCRHTGDCGIDHRAEPALCILQRPFRREYMLCPGELARSLVWPD